MLKRSYLFNFVFGLLGGLLVLGGYLWLSPSNGYQFSSNELPINYAKFANLPDGEGMNNFTKASAIATPAVVHIKTSQTVKTTSRKGDERYDDFFKDFFDDRFDFRGPGGPGVSSGSGVIISTDGYIVTNNHVIDNADKIEVTLNNNKTYTATLVGADPSTDLAVVKIQETNLPILKFGDSDGLQVGEWVLAVGNPFNLTSTVTAGIVSAKARSINLLSDKFKIESFIQTDAAVNPGNSGGALINDHAELIGVNTAIASMTGSFSGYSFAVPSTIVKKVVDDLINYGNVQRGFLGVIIRDVNSELAKEENLSISQGVFISEINKGSAAEAAGLLQGDVILKIDGTPINTAAALQEQIGRHRPGDKVKVTILRKGSEQDVSVELKNQSGNTDIVRKETDATLSTVGAVVEPLSDKEMSSLKVKSGVKITELRPGKLRSAGIREGFIVTHIDKKAIRTKEEFINAIKGKEGAVLFEGLYEAGDKDAYAVIF